jgi:hypothetical protein
MIHNEFVPEGKNGEFYKYAGQVTEWICGVRL